MLTLSFATSKNWPVFAWSRLAYFLLEAPLEGTLVMQKENLSIDTMDYMESIEYVAHTDFVAEASDSKIDEPTVNSIAAALEAQQRERAAFTQDTGILLDRDGRLLHRSERA